MEHSGVCKANTKEPWQPVLLACALKVAPLSLCLRYPCCLQAPSVTPGCAMCQSALQESPSHLVTGEHHWVFICNNNRVWCIPPVDAGIACTTWCHFNKAQHMRTSLCTDSLPHEADVMLLLPAGCMLTRTACWCPPRS